MEEFCKNHLANLIATNPEIYFRVTNHLRSFIEKDGYITDFNSLDRYEPSIEFSADYNFDNIGISLEKNPYLESIKWEIASLDILPFLEELDKNFEVLNIQVMFYGESSRKVMQFERVSDISLLKDNQDFISGGSISGGSILRNIYINVKRDS